jgi:hypothetical protein
MISRLEWEREFETISFQPKLTREERRAYIKDVLRIMRKTNRTQPLYYTYSLKGNQE